MPLPRGKKSRPTMCSRTLLFPDDCDPMTTICGRSKGQGTLAAANVSCSLLTVFTNSWSIIFVRLCYSRQEMPRGQ